MDLIIGAIVTIFLVILIENLRRPKLELKILAPKNKDYSGQDKSAKK